ncbi:class I SAM-dependent methyltransferase [Rhizobium leguminosarum]|uniref:class I SAM-dependent methyltransferase n=1 Tax=Rhizobium leguminosarum TaxID=384 RepID=UPI003F946B34
MSRLDSFIRRLTAQRDILNSISDLVAETPGPVLEFGLGNGRTYDHLRENFPGRRIVAFDWEVRSYSASTPSPEDMVTGNIRESGQAFVGISAALAHADIGTGHDEIDAVTLTWLPQLMAGVLAHNGIAVSGLPLEHPELVGLPLPDGIKEGRYFLYRKT